MRMAWQIFLAKITRSPRPVSVNLQVTKMCNLRCPYCFADLETLKEVDDLSTDDILETIDELYKFGCRHIILMGGEPLCRRDIGKIIRYIKSKWMRCEIVVNGYFVKKYVEDLKLCDSVCISLDGPAASNDILRGKGCHDKVIEALRILKENNIQARIHAILTRYNFQDGPPYIAETAKKFGFPFNFSMVMLRPEIRQDYLEFTEEETIDFIQRYKQLKDQGYPVFTSDTCFQYMEKWPKKGEFTIFERDKLNKEQMKWVVPCNYGKFNAFVDVDGMVYKCCLTWKNGLNWRKHGMRKCLEHISTNLLDCVSCRSFGDIDRALLLNFASLGNSVMVLKYISKKVLGGKSSH